MKRPTTRVVVVDASPTEAAALRRAMLEVDGDIEVVGQAGTADGRGQGRGRHRHRRSSPWT